VAGAARDGAVKRSPRAAPGAEHGRLLLHEHLRTRRAWFQIHDDDRDQVMDGLPNAGAATLILLLLAATAVAHVGAATAVIYWLVNHRVARFVHLATLALVAAVYVSVAASDPRMFIGLLLGRTVGQIKDDFPILLTLPFVPLSLLFAFLTPLIRRFTRTRPSPKA
jgi:hypothetical protein